MKILIAGDLYIDDQFQNRDLIDKSIEDLFTQVDYRIVNLEAPLTSDRSENKIIKTGPHLRMSEQTAIPYIRQLNIDGVTMANNHILDYSAKGLTDTFEVLKKQQIEYVGAGNNLAESNKPLTLEQDGMKIAILNFCENEWSIAEETKPGANPMDIIDNFNQINKAKESHDKVICIIHGGIEYLNLPSPRMVKQYRFYAESGADVIIGHHSHCIGGYEIHNNTPIFYSLGNFIFTLPSKHLDWYTGLVLRLNINKTTELDFTLIPVEQDKNSFKIKLASNKIPILAKIEDGRNIIEDKVLLKNEWENFINSKSENYLFIISNLGSLNNKYLRSFARIIYRIFRLNIMNINILLNMIRCESHRDALKTILKIKLKKR